MTEGMLTAIVSGIITITTMVIGFLTLWIKLKYGVDKANEAAVNAKVVEAKIDTNTAITKSAASASITNAKIAADAASKAKVATEDIARQLNGALDEKITNIVENQIKSLVSMIDSHAQQDEDNMKEIMTAISKLNTLIISNIGPTVTE